MFCVKFLRTGPSDRPPSSWAPIKLSFTQWGPHVPDLIDEVPYQRLSIFQYVLDTLHCFISIGEATLARCPWAGPHRHSPTCNTKWLFVKKSWRYRANRTRRPAFRRGGEWCGVRNCARHPAFRRIGAAFWAFNAASVFRRDGKKRGVQNCDAAAGISPRRRGARRSELRRGIQNYGGMARRFGGLAKGMSQSVMRLWVTHFREHWET